jgi:transposase
MVDGKVTATVKTFQRTTGDLMTLSEWLSAESVTDIAMEATGVYWKPIWHILADGDFKLLLANAAHVKSVPGRQKGAHAALSNAACRKFGASRSFFARCGMPPPQPPDPKTTLR